MGNSENRSGRPKEKWGVHKSPNGAAILSENGTKTGEMMLQERGPEFFSEMGKLGNAARSPESRKETARKAGEALKAARGSDFYKKIAQKSVEARRQKGLVPPKP